MVRTILCITQDDGLKECRYSTGSNLNTYSALIQNFYSQETGPHPAILVSVNTGVEEGKEAGVTAYTRCVCILS